MLSFRDKLFLRNASDLEAPDEPYPGLPWSRRPGMAERGAAAQLAGNKYYYCYS